MLKNIKIFVASTRFKTNFILAQFGEKFCKINSSNEPKHTALIRAKKKLLNIIRE